MQEGARYRVVTEPTHGYRRLEPLPSVAFLEDYYTEHYAEIGSETAPDVQRLRSKSDEGSAERDWRFQTVYADVLHLVREAGLLSGNVVDVGCGTGEFLRFLTDPSNGAWSTVGVEPNSGLRQLAADDGSRTVVGNIEELDAAGAGPADLVTMFNVLEHVREPAYSLRRARDLLRPGGLAVVQVPNDFSTLQEATRTMLDRDEWWIATPDHINYFGFESLESLLRESGFEPLDRLGTFPMEFFLIAGVDYLSDAEEGRQAHRRRCEFEMALPGELRRQLARDFATAGLGRNCLVIARRN